MFLHLVDLVKYVDLYIHIGETELFLHFYWKELNTEVKRGGEHDELFSIILSRKLGTVLGQPNLF